MNENDFQLITVSSHQHADEFFKKFKRELDLVAKGNALVMRASLPDEGLIMVQSYPNGRVYHNVSLEQIGSVIAALLQNQEDASLTKQPSLYIDDLALLLRLNMQATEANICGKCSPCRIGGPLIHDLLEQYKTGKNITNAQHIKHQLADVGFTMKNASMCAVGMFGADPLLFALDKWPKYFSNIHQ